MLPVGDTRFAAVGEGVLSSGPGWKTLMATPEAVELSTFQREVSELARVKTSRAHREGHVTRGRKDRSTQCKACDNATLSPVRQGQWRE